MPTVSAWSSYVPHSKDTLVGKVVDLYGLGRDEELEAKALQFLNEAVDELNTHLWEFNKTSESITMVAGQTWVPTTNAVYKEHAAYIVNATTGDIDHPLEFIGWHLFQNIFGTPNDSGTPMAYSYENLHRTGKLYLAPYPPASPSTFVTDFTLTFQYYRRIPHLSEEDPLQVPREAEQMILNGAYRRMAAHLLGAAHPDVAAYATLADRAYDQLRGIDRRNPEEHTRFRLMPPRSLPSFPTDGKLPWWMVFN